jgi:Fe-S-cluster containining protein
MSDESQKTPAETTQINFSLGAGRIRVNASVEVPVGETNPTKLLPVFQQLTSDIVSAVGVAFDESATPISCRAGCGACCRQLVPINLFEAEALAEWMRSLPEERQQELLGRFSVALQQLRESGLLARMSGAQFWTQTPDQSERFMLEYKRFNIACPFLENESCGIHPIRPLICREYVVTSSPEFCETLEKDKVKRIEIPVKASDAMFRMAAMIDRNERGWIPLVFFAEWMKGNGKPGDAFSGAGPQVLYAFLQALSPPKEESAPA